MRSGDEVMNEWAALQAAAVLLCADVERRLLLSLGRILTHGHRRPAMREEAAVGVKVSS
jgi:hypothetical protein